MRFRTYVADMYRLCDMFGLGFEFSDHLFSKLACWIAVIHFARYHIRSKKAKNNQSNSQTPRKPEPPPRSSPHLNRLRGGSEPQGYVDLDDPSSYAWHKPGRGGNPRRGIPRGGTPGRARSRGAEGASRGGARRRNGKWGHVISVAGTGDGSVYTDGIGFQAEFLSLCGMTVTPEGTLLVVDKLANRIRELRFKNSSRCANVTTFAGDGTFGWTDGPLDFANFYQPSNIVAAPDGSVFVCDAGNHRIRRIKPNGNVYHYAGIIRCNEIVTNDPVKDILKDKRIRWEFFTEGVEDGQATDTAQFHNPEGIGLGPDGSVYVADSNNDRIRRISPDGFKVSTYVGKKGFGRGVEDGPLYKARFFNPYGLTVSPNGNVYISEWCTQRIRLITPNRVVTTIAGDGTEGYQDGTGTNSKFSYPLGLASDKEGNVYVADKHNNAIRMISPELQVTTIVGGNGWGQRDGLVEYAQLNAPRSITISPDGSIYISDLYNMLVRKVIYTNSPQLEESKEEDLPKAPKTSQILSMYSMLKQARNMSALIDPKEAEWSPDRGFYTSEQHVTGPLSKRGNEGLPGDTW